MTLLIGLTVLSLFLASCGRRETASPGEPPPILPMTRWDLIGFGVITLVIAGMMYLITKKINSNSWKIGRVQVTVNGVGVLPITRVDRPRDHADNLFIAIDVTLKNTSKETVTVSKLLEGFVLKHWSHSYRQTVHSKQRKLNVRKLAPSQQITGHLVYEVPPPDSQRALSFAYHSDKKTVNWHLGAGMVLPRTTASTPAEVPALEEAWPPYFSLRTWMLLLIGYGALFFVLAIIGGFFPPLLSWIGALFTGVEAVKGAYDVVVWLVIIAFFVWVLATDADERDMIGAGLIIFGAFTTINVFYALASAAAGNSFFAVFIQQYVEPFEWLYNLIRWLYGLVFG